MTVHYGKLPVEILRRGVLAHLTRGELLIYVVIGLHARRVADFKAKVSTKQIAAESGLTQRYVRRVVRRLEGVGVLRVIVKGGRYSNLYELVSVPDSHQHTMDFSIGEANAAGAGMRLATVPQKDPSGRASTGPTTPGLVVSPLNTKTSLQGTHKETVVDLNQAQEVEVRQELGRHGIVGAGANSLLRQFPTLTLGLISKALNDIGSSAGAGARVMVLRLELPALIQREERREKARGLASERLTTVIEVLAARFGSCGAAADSALHGGVGALDVSEVGAIAVSLLARRIGDDSYAHEVARAWFESAGDHPAAVALRSDAFTDLNCRRAAEKHRAQKRRLAAEQRKATAKRQARINDKERARWVEANAWFDGLPNDGVVSCFQELVLHASNERFRNRFSSGIPAPNEIRQRFKGELIRRFAPSLQNGNGHKPRTLKGALR